MARGRAEGAARLAMRVHLLAPTSCREHENENGAHPAEAVGATKHVVRPVEAVGAS